MKRVFRLIITAAVIASTAAAAVIPAGAVRLLMGDVNGDCTISLRDATLAQKIQLNMITPSADDRYAADMDRSGTIDVKDAYMIQRLAGRDSVMMEGDTSQNIPAFCPNRSSRMGFYDALNADRASKGLSTVTPNDAMLAAGQELCEQWRIEVAEAVANGGTPDYSGNRLDNPDSSGGSWNNVFYDYGMTYKGIGLIDAKYNSAYVDGAAYYNYIKNEVTNQGSSSAYYQFYNRLLMRTELKIICVGETKISRDTAHWIIMGY